MKSSKPHAAKAQQKQSRARLIHLFDRHKLHVINCWMNDNEQPVILAHLRRTQLKALIGSSLYKQEPPHRIKDEETGKTTSFVQVSITGTGTTTHSATALYASRARKPPLVKIPIPFHICEPWATILALVPIAEPKKSRR